jgi:hypothetical protein
VAIPKACAIQLYCAHITASDGFVRSQETHAHRQTLTTVATMAAISGAGELFAPHNSFGQDSVSAIGFNAIQ